MALFGKKKPIEKAEKPKNSTLELIKETMAEAEAEKARAQEVAPVPASDELKALIEVFLKNRNQQNIQNILKCLQLPKTFVSIPAKVVTSDEDREKLKQAGNHKLENPVKITPILLTDNTGKKVFPVFSDEKQIPKNLLADAQKVNVPFMSCVGMLKDAKDVGTVVLDPYTANIRIDIEMNKTN